MSKSNLVLRNRILSNLETYDDKQMINIQQSVPILNKAKILKILMSLEQTKQKIKLGSITQGRYKEEAKFVYFLWKAIAKQSIKIETFKYIIVELQESHSFLQLIKNLQYVVGNNQENTIKKLFDSWNRLKQDRQYYQSLKKQRKPKQQQKQNASKLNSNNEDFLMANNYSVMNKTLKNIGEARNRSNSNNNNFCSNISSNSSSCKNLFNLNFSNSNSLSPLTSLKNTQAVKTRQILKTKKEPTQINQLYVKSRQHLKTQAHVEYNANTYGRQVFKTQQYQNQNQENQSLQALLPKPKLNSNQQKLLIQRLYQNKKYQEREKLKQKFKTEVQEQQLKICTFKPDLITQTQKGKSLMRSSSQTKNTTLINGFQKAVTRMKVGQSKSKVKKQLEQYFSVGQNYQKIKQKPTNPPSFLTRKQNHAPQIVLFIIQFELGRHKVKVKIHPTDTQVSVAKRLTKIYGLKRHEQEQIQQILGRQLNNYYRQINSCEGQTKQFEQNVSSQKKKDNKLNMNIDDWIDNQGNDERAELIDLFNKIRR